MSEIKGHLIMQVSSSPDFTQRMTADITAVQWHDLRAVANGQPTFNENTLRKLLGDILDTVGVPYDAVDKGCVTVDEDRINAASTWLKENP